MVYYGRLGRKVEKFRAKISLTGCKWSSLNAPSTETPVSHSLLGEFPFPIFNPCSLLPLSAVKRIGLLWEAGQKHPRVHINEDKQDKRPSLVLLLLREKHPREQRQHSSQRLATAAEKANCVKRSLENAVARSVTISNFDLEQCSERWG